MTPPSRALRALLSGVVDYAGLFPPAKLPMADAAAAYALHTREESSWALGKFVVPAARLNELAAAADALPPAAGMRGGWRLSVLAGADAAADAGAIARFTERHGGRFLVDAVEAKACTTREIEAARRAFPPPLDLYLEIPIADDPRALVRHIGAVGARAKVRTGGVTEDAFPSPADLARFLHACALERVAFKATAGLHHPLRSVHRLTYDAGAPTGTMFGFLNVFLAAAWLRDGMPPGDAERLLDERDPSAIAFDDQAVTWRGQRLAADRLESARREHAIAFGSCSFAEPIADLRALALLPATS